MKAKGVIVRRVVGGGGSVGSADPPPGTQAEIKLSQEEFADYWAAF